MVERVARYLIEVYGLEEAVGFATHAVADARASGKPTMASEWELVIGLLRNPERVAQASEFADDQLERDVCRKDL